MQKKCYRQNFLSQVILRADFASSRIGDLVECEKFGAGVAEKFPHVLATPLVGLEFEINEGMGGLKRNSLGTQWSFKKAPTDASQAVLTPTYLALERGPGEHNSFQSLFEEFTLLMDQLSKSYGVFPLDRIGLRYVNEVRLPGKALDWKDLIRDELVTAVLTPAMGKEGRLLRSMHQLVELHGEDQVHFTYGIYNPDFPAPAVQRHFIIDVDCNRTGVIPKDEALGCIDNLNEYASNAFESSIKDGLREIMGVIE